MTMPRLAIVVAGLTLATCLISCSNQDPTAGHSMSVQEVASYSGADRREFLDKCAAREGSLSVAYREAHRGWTSLIDRYIIK